MNTGGLLSNVFDNIPSYGINDKENHVYVNMIDVTTDTINLFKDSVIDQPFLHFQNGLFEELAVTVRPGGPINSPSGNSSLGFRVQSTATLDSRTGFVMSGHATTGVNNIIRNNNSAGTTIGTVARRQFSGSVDAAFVAATSGTTLSTSILQNNLITGTASQNPANNSTVFFVGRNNTSTARSGTVVSTNHSANLNGVTLTNLTRANFSPVPAPGDSGGLVYQHTIPQAGVIVGGNVVSAHGSFTKISLILAALQVRLF